MLVSPTNHGGNYVMESWAIGSIETYKIAENLRDRRHIGAIIPHCHY
jgi:hypothetical protein